MFGHILLIPQGFTINRATDWKPVWSWSFFLIMSVFLFSFTTIPFIFLFIKIYKTFEVRDLKKKLKYFFIGYCGMTIATYGGMLYNTYDNELFKLIWSITVLFLTIPGMILIYYGIASSLKA